jgi:adenylate kinase
MPERNVVLLGPPGAGKGTQARPFAAEHGLEYVSTGALLRSAASLDSPAGRAAARHMAAGELVPDAIVIELLREALRHDGFVLDGFPRTIGQAEALDGELARIGFALPQAVVLEVPDEALVERLSGRRICEAAGHEYHVTFHPPAQPGRCDIDGSPLVRREDDQPAAIRRRLAVYHSRTEPLLGYYESRGRLSRVDGAGSPAEIASRLAAVLATPAPPPAA